MTSNKPLWGRLSEHRRFLLLGSFTALVAYLAVIVYCVFGPDTAWLTAYHESLRWVLLPVGVFLVFANAGISIYLERKFR